MATTVTAAAAKRTMRGNNHSLALLLLLPLLVFTAAAAVSANSSFSSDAFSTGPDDAATDDDDHDHDHGHNEPTVYELALRHLGVSSADVRRFNYDDATGRATGELTDGRTFDLDVAELREEAAVGLSICLFLI